MKSAIPTTELKVRFRETRKPARETHALPKPGNELLVRDGGLAAALKESSSGV